MNQAEENRLIELRQTRRKSPRLIVSKLITQKMLKAVEDGRSWVWPFAFMLAIFNDLIDIGIIGSLPIIGDIVDFIVWAILFAFTMSLGGHLRIKIRIMVSLAGFFELLPIVVMDLLPIWTLVVLWAYYRTQKSSEIAERGLKKYKQGKVDREALAEFN